MYSFPQALCFPNVTHSHAAVGPGHTVTRLASRAMALGAGLHFKSIQLDFKRRPAQITRVRSVLLKSAKNRW